MSTAWHKKPVLGSVSRVVQRPGAGKRGRNLFELAFLFKNYGVGLRFTRKSWQYEEPCYWTISKFQPRRSKNAGLQRGKAWGVLTWRGKTEERVRKIPSPLKREWRFIPEGAQPPTYVVPKIDVLLPMRPGIYEVLTPEGPIRPEDREVQAKVADETLEELAEIKRLVAEGKAATQPPQERLEMVSRLQAEKDLAEGKEVADEDLEEEEEEKEEQEEAPQKEREAK
ncbi:28S ribosomal protein S34, mitochondrial [Balamuthia mandrillaris]